MIDIKECLRLHLLWLKEDPEGKRANLYGADLRGADLRGANLYEANLRRADLRGANLSGADLRGADLSGADLREADLYGANLGGADLYRADLGGADLLGANLRRADLSGANLSKTILEGKTILSFSFGKHTAYFYGSDDITIGCYKKSISDWMQNYKEIGAKEGYTPDQIKKYGKFIKGCANILKESA